MWVGGIAFAVGLMVTVSLVVVPVFQTRRVVSDLLPTLHPYEPTSADLLADGVSALGGREAAIRKISLYSRMPSSIAPSRWVAVKFLGACGAKGAPTAITALKGEDVLMRYAAVEALGNIGSPDNVAPLADCMRDTDPTMRVLAVQALGKIESPDVVDHLLTALKDSEERVSDAGRKALVGVVGKPLEKLVEAHQKGVAPQGVDGSFAGMGKRQDPRLVRFFVRVLQDGESWPLRVEATFALAKLNGDQAVQALLGALEDKSEPVRIGAVMALGARGESAAVQRLRRVAADDAPSVRKAAAEALEKIKKAQEEQKEKLEPPPPGE
jgi:HEAT repeat protein